MDEKGTNGKMKSLLFSQGGEGSRGGGWRMPGLPRSQFRRGIHRRSEQSVTDSVPKRDLPEV